MKLSPKMHQNLLVLSDTVQLIQARATDVHRKSPSL